MLSVSFEHKLQRRIDPPHSQRACNEFAFIADNHNIKFMSSYALQLVVIAGYLTVYTNIQANIF